MKRGGSITRTGRPGATQPSRNQSSPVQWELGHRGDPGPDGDASWSRERGRNTLVSLRPPAIGQAYLKAQIQEMPRAGPLEASRVSKDDECRF